MKSKDDIWPTGSFQDAMRACASLDLWGKPGLLIAGPLQLEMRYCAWRVVAQSLNVLE
jgi:hypothetical protein